MPTQTVTVIGDWFDYRLLRLIRLADRISNSWINSRNLYSRECDPCPRVYIFGAIKLRRRRKEMKMEEKSK